MSQAVDRRVDPQPLGSRVSSPSHVHTEARAWAGPLRMGVGVRLAAAAVVSGLLWLATLWAVS